MVEVCICASQINAQDSPCWPPFLVDQRIPVELEKVSSVRRFCDRLLTLHYTVIQNPGSVSECIAVEHFSVEARHSEDVSEKVKHDGSLDVGKSLNRSSYGDLDYGVDIYRGVFLGNDQTRLSKDFPSTVGVSPNG
jgi:hypothetical protein